MLTSTITGCFMIKILEGMLFSNVFMSMCSFLGVAAELYDWYCKSFT